MERRRVVGKHRRSKGYGPNNRIVGGGNTVQAVERKVGPTSYPVLV